MEASTPSPPLDELFERHYQELRQLARARLSGGGRNTLLDTTSLVHESFLRLAGFDAHAFPDRARFFVYAAKVMRSVIVDIARQRQSLRRGGDAVVVSDDVELENVAAAGEEQILRLDEALQQLAQRDARMAQVVELRYFAGLEMGDIAEVLGISRATAQRDWDVARAFLYQALS